MILQLKIDGVSNIVLMTKSKLPNQIDFKLQNH